MNNNSPTTVKDFKTIGRTMRRIRLKKKISARWVAEQVGISTTSLSRIENGHTFPAFENFINLCKALDIAIILQESEKAI